MVRGCVGKALGFCTHNGAPIRSHLTHRVLFLNIGGFDLPNVSCDRYNRRLCINSGRTILRRIRL